MQFGKTLALFGAALVALVQAAPISAPVAVAVAAPVAEPVAEATTEIPSSIEERAGGGTLTIKNNCPSSTQLWINEGTASATLFKQGQATSVPMNTGDQTYKISNGQNNQFVAMPQGQTAQIEFSASSYISWDLSLIKGNPMVSGGSTVEIAGAPANNAACLPTIKCDPGATTCHGAYNTVDDNPKPDLTQSCPSTVSITWTLCG